MGVQIHNSPFTHGTGEHAPDHCLHRIAVDEDDVYLVAKDLGQLDLADTRTFAAEIAVVDELASVEIGVGMDRGGLPGTCATGCHGYE